MNVYELFNVAVGVDGYLFENKKAIIKSYKNTWSVSPDVSGLLKIDEDLIWKCDDLHVSVHMSIPD